MPIIRNIARLFLIIFAIAVCVIILSPSKPTRCCYVCEYPVNDTDTWCKICAYPLDSTVIRNMKWFEKPACGLHSGKPGNW